MGTLSIPLSSEDEAVLRRIASVHRLTDSEAAAANLHAYLKFESEQIAKIRASLDAADRGEFVSDVEMDAFFAEYGADINGVDAVIVGLRKLRADRRQCADTHSAEVESWR